ncbi:16S rRNA pseudouridine(516) synthase [Enterococcus rivorum]|uniref:Pseudouridine synthase n=1 Tax=Enterococcus rivorum TaxID=762845 RepID=A0A1E5L1Z7_9ENTE|nr:16S rRNA pseudouridine(516) synthase [Enterococcus rivorum]MBP2098758.1 16S rRNA pseudouridine516 synthase [Enterococcus rivorum]OEH83949.1 16S rRNA pseudouridine(516) synthase [Enterococcus rivorum]
MRLDKLLEHENFGSRKKVKRLIRSKKVKIDGKVVTCENQNVDAQLQEITVEDTVITQKTHEYFMLNKPQGVVTAVHDKDHQTVVDLIKEEDYRQKLYPVGRLDRDTEGLLLITDNGQLGYQLLLPHKNVTKRYEVIVNERLNDEDVKSFQEGIVFHGGECCKPAVLSILSTSDNESRAYLDIDEGKFHQVKKMFLSVGKKVTFLKRLKMGPIELDQQLKPGEYRRLTPKELETLLPYFYK